jgi:hypothetical protein
MLQGALNIVGFTPVDRKVRKTPSWPRSWANFSIF